MKNIVVFDEYNEIDFKPSDLLNQYIELTKEDVGQLLIEGKKLKDCACPACHETKTEEAFTKFGLQYKECYNCHTLYISPRPDDTVLHSYYSNAKARIFWRNELAKATNSKRKEKIIKPRFQWITESTQEYLPQAEHYADINTNQYGYAEEIAKTELFTRKTLISPFLNFDHMPLNPSICTLNTPWQKVNLNNIDVISLFEVSDRVSDIDTLFAKVHSMLKKDGLCFMTDILISGFDMQILWDKAENLFPPDRLNVFSIEGLRHLFKRHNFECIELSTPGILDVEIVRKTLSENAQSSIPKFIQYMLKRRDNEVRKSFQEFLQANLLSSYGRILLRRR